MTNLEIDAVFNQLDRDRHLAGYRLEERASPFFKIFLPRVMERCGMAIREPIIPEFPYAKEKGNNRSSKVDFFALSARGDRAFLIELKTEMGSLKGGQITRLQKAADEGIHKLLADLKAMSTPSKRQSRDKYSHVLWCLEALKLTHRDGQPKNDCEAIMGDCKPKIVYILPKGRAISNAKTITFKQFARALRETPGDLAYLAERFAQSLECWAKNPAGSVPPSGPCP